MRQVAVLAVLAAAAVALAVLVGAEEPEREPAADGLEVFARALESLEAPMYPPVVARVNGEPVSGESIQIEMVAYEEGKRAFPEAYKDVAPPDPGAVLDTLIRGEVIYQEAERRGVLCTDQEVVELAEAMFGDGELAAGLAAHLGVTLDELATVPEVFEQYARLCAGPKLSDAVVPAGTTKQEKIRAFDEFVESLTAAADVEILEPALR